MKFVKDIMTPIVHSIHGDKFVNEVEGILDKYNISGAPLVDNDGKVIGIISKTDINHFNFTEGDANSTRVWELAWRDIISIGISATIEEAARKMLDEDVHRLLVVNEKKMVGLLSSFDFVRLVAEKDIKGSK